MLGLLVVASCQLFTEDIVQCSKDEDCDARGGEFIGSKCRERVCAGPLSCKGNVVWEAEDPARPIHSNILFVNSMLDPVVGAKVIVCAQLDPQCDKPIGGPYVTNDRGYALVELPRAFRGQVQVREPPPGFDESFMTASVLIFPPIVIEETAATVVPPYAAVRLFSRTQLDFLLRVLGSKTEPGKSHVFGAVYNCHYSPLRDATVKMTAPDPNALAFLGDANDTPTPTTLRATTAGSAIFGFLNVTPGLLQFESAYRNERVSSIQIITSPDVITTFVMPPSP